MKFWEAMKALEEGEKVRCSRWNPAAYAEKTRSGGLSFHKADHRCFNIYSCNDFIEEWELYEEPEQTLSFAEVVKGLKEGKEFKRMAWVNKNYFICLLSQSPGITGPEGKAWWSYPEDFEATDWVEVK